MPTGLHSPDTIDLITEDPNRQEMILYIVGPETWDDSNEEKGLLVRKINNYFHFVTAGELVRRYPQSDGKGVRFRLDCTTPPPPGIRKAVEQATELLSREQINMDINFLD